MAFNNKSHEEGEKLVVVLDRNTVSSNKWRGRNGRITYVPHYSDTNLLLYTKDTRSDPWRLVWGIV